MGTPFHERATPFGVGTPPLPNPPHPNSSRVHINFHPCPPIFTRDNYHDMGNHLKQQAFMKQNHHSPESILLPDLLASGCKSTEWSHASPTSLIGCLRNDVSCWQNCKSCRKTQSHPTPPHPTPPHPTPPHPTAQSSALRSKFCSGS